MDTDASVGAPGPSGGRAIGVNGELPDGFAITEALLRTTIERQGNSASVGRGDIVLVRTGQLTRDGRFMCVDCGVRTSATAGTVFDRTRTPMTVWFRACWMFGTQKDGVLVVSVQKALEISSYETAWAIIAGSA